MSEQKYYELFPKKPTKDERPSVFQFLPPASPIAPYFPPSNPRPRQVFAEYNLWGPPSERLPGLIRSSIFNVAPKHDGPPIQVLEPPRTAPMPLMIQMPPTRITPCIPYDTVDEAVGKAEVERMCTLEQIEVEEQKCISMDKPEDRDKRLILKEFLFADCSDCEDDPDSADFLSIDCSNSSSDEWDDPDETSNCRWQSRSSRVNNRGRNSNLMQRKLTRALSKPVRMAKEADTTLRPGWNSGCLGRISNPVEPDALYGFGTGYGQYSPIVSSPLMPSPPPPRPLPLQPNAKSKDRTASVLCQGINSNSYRFRTNFLKLILEFVEDDKCIELFFDKRLMSGERKKIHNMVLCFENGDNIALDDRQHQILSQIQIRKRYHLRTCSVGDGEDSEICLFKQASADIFVVIPDDVRPCNTEILKTEEDTNPFLKSITKHVKEDAGSGLQPDPPFLLDRLTELFLEFSEGENFTEFRFLGPFCDREIQVMDKFRDLITDLTIQKMPKFIVPLEFLGVFTKADRFRTDNSFGVFVTIKKVHYDLRKEFNKQQEEQRSSYLRGNLQNSPSEPMNRYILNNHIQL